MTIYEDAWQAGIDAVIADPTINRGAFVDAMQTVITSGLANSEGNAYVDAVAGVYESVGLINNATFNNLRNEIASEGAVTARAAFDALAVSINALPEAEPVIQAASLLQLRQDRDNTDAAIDRLQELIDNEPAGPLRSLVRGAIRPGKQLLQENKQAIRDQIRNLTEDPDS